MSEKEKTEGQIKKEELFYSKKSAFELRSPEELVIPYCKIQKIGDDVILVQVESVAHK